MDGGTESERRDKMNPGREVACRTNTRVMDTGHEQTGAKTRSVGRQYNWKKDDEMPPGTPP